MEEKTEQITDFRVVISYFLGFIYAATISVVLDFSNQRSLFSSPGPLAVILFIIVFFAQDWVVRSRGQRQIGGIRNILFASKIFFEITIVYFLLLASLDAVELLSKSENEAMALGNSNTRLYYKIAMFAFVSGAWNIVMLRASERFTWRNAVTLLGGHMDEKVLGDLFPHVKDWAPETAKWVREELAKLESLNPRALVFSLKLLLVGSLRNTKLLPPYLIGIHCLSLNIVLGLAILLSAFACGGRNLSSEIPLLKNIPVLWAFLSSVILLCLASPWIFTAYHCSKKKRPYLERMGFYLLFVALLVAYIIADAWILAIFLLFQQILANLFINKFLTHVKEQDIVRAELESSLKTIVKFVTKYTNRRDKTKNK